MVNQPVAGSPYGLGLTHVRSFPGAPESPRLQNSVPQIYCNSYDDEDDEVSAFSAARSRPAFVASLGEVNTSGDHGSGRSRRSTPNSRPSDPRARIKSAPPSEA